MLARLVAMPVAGLGSLLAMRWLAEGRPVGDFAFLALVTGLPMLFTFAELGYGGVASSAVGATRDEPQRAGRVIGAIATLYLLVAALVGVVVLVGATFAPAAGPGAWLGFPGLQSPAATALVLTALGVPASLGARVFIGLDRATFVVAMQAVPAVLTAGLVWLLLAADAGTAVLAAALVAGTLAVNLPLTVAALLRVRARPVSPLRLRAALATGGYPAWPNFAASLAAVAMTQLPRLVLSHRGEDTAVAQLGLALVFFVPAASLVFVAGQALWSDFSLANAGGGLESGQLLGAVKHSAVVGLVFATGFAAVGPVLAQLLTPGIGAPFGLYAALGVLLLCFALDLPLNVAMLTGPLAVRRGALVLLQLVTGLLLSLLVPVGDGVALVWVQTLTLVGLVLLPSMRWSLRAPVRPTPEPVGRV